MLANLARLREKMDDLGLDGLVATTAENLYYLTGIQSVALEMFPHTGQCYAVLSRERLQEPYLVSFKCEVDQALDAMPPLADAVAYGTFYREIPEGVRLTAAEERLTRIAVDAPYHASAQDALTALLRRLGLAGGKIAVDEDGVAHGFFDALADALPGASLVPGAQLLRWVRKVKTPEEIRRVAAAARVAEHAIVAAMSIAREGVTEVELVREFERSVVSAGARPKFTLIKIGRNAVAGQTSPTRAPLRHGDIIWFDVGCVYQGYWSDIARVCSLGAPSRRIQTLYDAMLAGENRALEQARPGMTGKELFELTVEAVRAAGAPHYRRHHVGHGIGVEVYDRVLITATNDDVIEEGTVVNIETPYYEFGLGAVHVEDPFAVHAAGNRLLTSLSRQLHVLEH